MNQPSQETGVLENPLETNRLRQLYEKLREQLLDLTRRNPLLNYGLKPRSKRFLQLVDCAIESVYERLIVDVASLPIVALPEPDSVPPDERSPEFVAALAWAKTTDIEYLSTIEALEASDDASETSFENTDRALRDRVRIKRNLPPRASRKEIDRAEHARSLGIDPNLSLCEEPREQEQLQTLKYPDELVSVMEKIADDARLAEQETGLSTLHLAFGFLEWYESENSDKKSLAPLLLLPVRIERSTAHGKPAYSIAASESGAEENLSLQKRLDRDFSRKLPDFATDGDNAPTPIEDYFKGVTDAIDGLKRWRMHRWLVLGHFSFGRFAMYADLDAQNWGELSANPLVGALLRGTDQKEDAAPLPGIPDDYQIDDPKIESIAPLLIQDADASQHSALVDVMQGENLVIQGPPGTGKSQTITNIIANALAKGKTVLFLAEKQAALEVVKRRLDNSGLGEFCLELHSDKVSPKSIITSLRARNERGSGQDLPVANQRGDTDWLSARNALNTYVKALNEPRPDGDSAFKLLWSAIYGRMVSPELASEFKGVELPLPLLQDPGHIRTLRAQLEDFKHIAQTYTKDCGHHPAQSPWKQLPLGEIHRYKISALQDAINALRASLEEGHALVENNSSYGITSEEDLSAVTDLSATLGEPPTPEAVDQIPPTDLPSLERAVRLRAELGNLEHELSRFPALQGLTVDRLSIASSLLETSVGATLAASHPAAALATVEEIVAAVQDVEPALTRLGVTFTAPASQATTAAVLVKSLLAIPPQYLRWMVENPAIRRAATINKTTLRTVMNHWQKLLNDENTWGQRVTGYQGKVRPSPAQLNTFAATLRKTGFGKIFATLSGSLHTARNYCTQLGIEQSPAELEALSAHVQNLQRFESDIEMAVALGTAWNALATPSKGIDQAATEWNQADMEWNEAVKAWERLFSTASTLSQQGDLLVGRILKLPLIEILCESSTQLNRLAGLDATSKALLNEQPLEKCLSEMRQWIALLQQFLSIDAEKRLSPIGASIKDISEIHRLRLRLEETRSNLSHCASESRAIALQLFENNFSAKEITTAIAWCGAVRGSRVPALMKDHLLSATLTTSHQDLREVKTHWNNITKTRPPLVKALTPFGTEQIAALPTNELLALLRELPDNGGGLAEFLKLRSLRSTLEQEGMKPFLDAIDTHLIEAHRIMGIFTMLVTTRRAGQARQGEGLADSPDGTTLDRRRQTFADRDRAKIKTDREIVRAHLLKRTPPTGSQSGPRNTWTNMRLLHNEFTKSKRFTPVRQLVARAGAAIQTLTPCFMMSPLSLAKFVAPRSLHFDLLVIDEASQMKPEDALGGMFRATQLVVVGDTKQLPPTDFFSRSGGEANTSSDEDDDDIDAESILEACERTFGKRRILKWHYRSRCESLIAFSNREFYENKLITFPMAKPGAFSVEHVRVNGTYRTRQNPDEAAAIARAAIAFMQHFANEPEESLPTLGIVAINTEQRDFINDELARMGSGDKLVEQYRQKAEAKSEPLFIKNLENVQGDERDHIFISMTYGCKHGEPAMAQRFGPINGKQGHRRLNVLFTRARARIGLFTSFGSEDVRPADGSSEGVTVLKRYLEYAETRGQAFGRQTGREADSAFEIAVAKQLRTKGYQIDLQIGVSGYRIDLGIRHPDRPEHFLAGVECDGATYHSSKSARDRDRLREEILKSLGWHIVRVWSTDWFDNPALETEKLARKLEELRTKPTPRSNSYPPLHGLVLNWETESARDTDTTTSAPSNDTEVKRKATNNRAENKPGTPQSPPLVQPPRTAETPKSKPKGVDIPLITAPSVVSPLSSVSHATYSIANPTDIGRPERDRFFDPDYKAILKRMIAHVVRIEGPIFENLLVDRIARAHGLMRSGNKIRDRVISLLRDVDRVDENGHKVIWPQGKKPGIVHPYRKDPSGTRKHDDVPAEELAAIALPFVQLRLGDEEILRKMADEFLLGRLHKLTRQRFTKAIQIAKGSG